MTPLDALAAAVRDRLLAGATAPLPGLGTLARAHVSARVRVGPDGERVLLPPGEAVGLSARTDDPADVARAVAHHSGAPDEAGAGLLRDAVDQLEARLAITGEVRLDGVGVFQRTSSGIRFGAVSDLLAAVNQRYEGLPPIPVPRAWGTSAEPEASAEPETPVPPLAPEAPSAPMPRPPAPPADAPPEALDILLDLIVNEPAETSAGTPEASEAAEAPRAEPAPSESAFADDPLESDPVLAVPFGSGDVALQDVLPPTPPERDPSLEAPDVAEEPVETSTLTETPQPLAPDDPVEALLASASVFVDEAGTDHEALGDADTPPAPPVRSVPDSPALADLPGRTPDLVATPAPTVKRRSHVAGWLLYAAVVLALAALLLWWTVEERRADPPMTTQAALALRPL